MSANYLGYLAAILYLLSALSILQKQLTENKKDYPLLFPVMLSISQ